MGRWLSGLRSSKGKRDAGEQQEDDTRRYQLAPISCSTKRLNQSREPEANTFGEKLAFFLKTFSTLLILRKWPGVQED